MARHRGRRQRVVPKLDRAAGRRESERIVARVTGVDADAPRALAQQRVVAQHDEPRAEVMQRMAGGQHRAQLGADAGRLAARDRERRMRGHRRAP